MKNNLRIPFLLTAALALTPLTSQASDNFEDGNLAVVFYSATGSGPTLALGPQYFVFNLGPASLFRENQANDVSVSTVNPLIADSNIATDLAAVFGANWASDGTVRMFVTSTVPTGTATLVGGDPATTIYGSVPRTSLNNGAQGAGVTLPSYLTSLRNSSSAKIRAFLYDGTNSAIAQTGGYTNSNPIIAPFGNAAGVRLPMTGNLINLSLYVPPATGALYFDVGTNPAAIFGAGTITGSAGVEGAVSMYRVLHSLTDTTFAPADLTSGSTTTNATIGAPQYIGTLSINSSGLLKVQAVGVAPAGSYATFAAANGMTADGPKGDTDKDGIINLVEYALALNPAGSDGAPGTYTGGLISFTKRAAAVTNGDLIYGIQESDDLGLTDPWQSVTPTSNTTTAITYQVPSGSPKKFARLVVKTTP